ncbi:OpgC family protein [Humitalea sp. 24SJ18S-53]|uniref:OpgC family protein n=1 Tax=Humitalea sp. 24SJ18S-53 TaxID=3422307 RepID=UPI003D66F7CF
MDGFIRQGRDLRADLCRGFALWAIFVNHVPGNWVGYVTPRNWSLSDATEAFVLLAGYAAGLAYGRLMDRQGWPYAASRVIGRVFTLYVAHIFLLVVFTAQVGYSAAALDSMAYLDELHLDPFADNAYRALLEALLLRYQPSFLNILPLYIVLLAMFAAALPLLRHAWVMLVLSLALYVVAREWPLSLPAWGGGGWFFNPLAWQLLFFCGCAIGYRPPGGVPMSIPWRPWLGFLCGLLLAAGFAAVVLLYFRWDWAQATLPEAVAGFLATIDKTSLHPMRLASILALTYLFAHAVPPDAAWLRAGWAKPMVVMGQQALPVFCAGIAFSFMGRLALEQSDRLAMQVAVNLAGAVALVAVGILTAWYGAEKRAENQRIVTKPALSPTTLADTP